MNIYFRAACVAGLALSAGACATITRTKHQAFEVKTKPPAASVKTSNGFQCDATPCSMTMLRNAEFDAVITKPGYKAVTVHVTHHMGVGGTAGVAGNILIGGIIGAAVDGSSGAMFDLTPNPVDVELEPEGPAAAPAAHPADATPATTAPAAAAPAAVAAPTPAAAPTSAAPAPAKPTDQAQ